MSKLRQDYLVEPGCTLMQDPRQFCLNTDTVLLAKFARPSKGDVLLDIGTNNGALLVYLDRHPLSKMIGVEILEEAAALARTNLEASAHHPFVVINADVRSAEMEPVDYIVSNPPFFTLAETFGITNPDARQKGRIEYNLSLEELIKSASRLLKSNGRMALAHRPERLGEITRLLDQYGLSLARVQTAFDESDGKARSILIEVIKDAKPNTQILEPLIIGRKGILSMRDLLEKTKGSDHG